MSPARPVVGEAKGVCTSVHLYSASHPTGSAPPFIDEHTIVPLRRLGGPWAIAATNSTNKARSLALKLPGDLESQPLHDAPGLAPAGRDAEGQRRFDIPALRGRVWVAAQR